jgi:hypothetical protein
VALTFNSTQSEFEIVLKFNEACHERCIYFTLWVRNGQLYLQHP